MGKGRRRSRNVSCYTDGFKGGNIGRPYIVYSAFAAIFHPSIRIPATVVADPDTWDGSTINGDPFYTIFPRPYRIKSRTSFPYSIDRRFDLGNWRQLRGRNGQRCWPLTREDSSRESKTVAVFASRDNDENSYLLIEAGKNSWKYSRSFVVLLIATALTDNERFAITRRKIRQFRESWRQFASLAASGGTRTVITLIFNGHDLRFLKSKQSGLLLLLLLLFQGNFPIFR